MSFFRKFVRVLLKALVIFASIHLIIIAVHAVRSGEWGVLTMSSIMDIRYLSSRNFSYVIEGGLWGVLVLLFGSLWFYDKER